MMDSYQCLLFPGQGSQYPGMLRDLHRHDPSARLVMRATEVAGIPLAELMQHGSAQDLADPLVAQLAVFVTSATKLDSLGFDQRSSPVVAGHSLGEITALYAAKSLGLDAALALVSCRGRLMAEAAREQDGCMAAVMGLPPEAEATVVPPDTDDVVVANRNSLRQFVISGSRSAVDAAVFRARQRGALRIVYLPVGGAYHSPLMKTAADEFEKELAAVDLQPLRRPMVSGVSGELVADEVEAKKLLGSQMMSTVEWVRVMESLDLLGVHRALEVGPGRVLQSLAKHQRQWPRVDDGDAVLATDRSAG